ncbi:spheroidene monooxygenase [Thermoactinospora rubra]|uniref:spheroidene monooxygenase n=1 Tax=Thermoactinospora rubra TaxID=1088767 RepID=UPI001F0AD3B0|nr:spheroidene monooxygenase [Thermoactinospora rubra]
MRHAAFDRPLLRRTAGLRFWRLLGTGRGRSTTPGADLRRWALLAVWRSEEDLEGFLRASPVAGRWRAEAREAWHVRLLPLAARGRWGGTDPFADVSARPAEWAGPVAVLTRAAIRPGRLVAFYRSVPAVDASLRDQEGCLRSVGMGEWPLARQATFSLWRDQAAVHGFAYRGAAHRDVIARVRAHNWYSEELFARFAPYAQEGTWDGSDPLTA